MLKLNCICLFLIFSCVATANGKSDKFSSHLIKPETFLPSGSEMPLNSDKDYQALKHIVDNLSEAKASVVTESMYNRITAITHRSPFRYYQPNILHCIFSTLVGVAGAVATVCTAGAAAPIVIPAVIAAVGSITSTGSYDLSKRELEKQENEYQDALTEIKQLYRNMTYYAANLLMQTIGNNKFWHVDDDEKEVVEKFIATPIKIALKMTYQLRLAPEVTSEIVGPLFYLQHVFYKMRESNEAIGQNIQKMRDENDTIEQIGRIRTIFTLLDTMDEIVTKQAQDEGLKIAIKTALNSFRFKILELHTGDLYSLVDKRTKSIKCAVTALTTAIKDKSQEHLDPQVINLCFSQDQ